MLRAGDFKSHGMYYVIICRTQTTSEGWLLRKKIWHYLHIPREVAQSPAGRILPGRWFGRAKSRGIMAASFLLPAMVVGNERGVIVGCLLQYQITMGFRPGNSRAAWPRALCNNQQQQQQRSHGGGRSGWFVSPSIMHGPATLRRGGDRSDLHGEIP